MRIFFQGGLEGEWASGWQRCETLQCLVDEVLPWCQNGFLQRAGPSRWERWAGRRRFHPAVVEEFNRHWLRAVLEFRPDAAWLEWPRLLQASTLAEARRRLPHCVFVAFYDDNPFGARTDERWQWDLFLEAVSEYDLFLVKRPADIVELRRRGARRVELFVHGSFDPLFYPQPGRRPAVHPVSFVGTALDHRVPFIRRLIRRERLPVHVFGNRWERSLFYHLHRDRFHRPVLGFAYADVIRDSAISLGFVSSSNRDEYSMRTFEIPACGGFMLAERTGAHEAFFQEGVEAEYFGGVEECAEKARFYLRHESARERIARAGHRRCLESGYTLRRRMSDALKLLTVPRRPWVQGPVSPAEGEAVGQVR